MSATNDEVVEVETTRAPPTATGARTSSSSSSCAEGTDGDVRQLFSAHHQEIMRRRSAGEECGRGSGFSSFAPSQNDCAQLPFILDGQEYVLYTISNKEMAPVCTDIYDPAVRIYGCFHDSDAALEYATSTGLVGSGVNVQIHPVRNWAVASSSPARMKEAGGKLDEILEHYRNRRAISRAEFEENVREHKMGETHTEADAEKSQGQRAGLHEHKVTLREKKKTAAFFHAPPPDAQTVLVVSFLPDPCPSATNGCEFAFQVLGALSTEQQADKWIRETLADRCPDIDLDVVQTGAWLFPQNAAKKIAKTVYRQEELNKIMANHASQPSKVAAFEEWKKQDSKEPFAGF